MLPPTEQENPKTKNIDRVSTVEAVRLINDEDKSVAPAVELVLPEIARCVDAIVARLQIGGRLFYVGAGTSGRLGVLDASEIPPTFGVSADLVQGVIAGGIAALYKATEASEDDAESGANDLRTRGLCAKDAVVGIAASGATEYTLGAVRYANNLGCFTACVVCAPDSALAKTAQIAVVPVVGAEALTGSTRLKSGTAQKMCLNMLSTVSMIRLGYVKGNRMTNVKSSNNKLKARSLRILMAEMNLNEREASELLNAAANDLRIAIVMHKGKISAEEAMKILRANGFVIEKSIEALKIKNF